MRSGLLKVDVLGLGMLTAIRRAFALVNEFGGCAGGRGRLDLSTVPAEDPAVYDMICRADTVGVFQIESRAQMAMLPRLRPHNYYDLVIEVAIVRPGPIQGEMVHPYLRRRNGEEPVSYPSDGGRSGAQAHPGRADFPGAGHAARDRRRRLLAGRGRPAAPRDGGLEAQGRLGALPAALDRRHARARLCGEFRACRSSIRYWGSASMDFPESHAASFALLVYTSAWLKHHEPAAFCAALINSQPMGFYAPAQLVRDARVAWRRGAAGVDVAKSDWDCTLERGRTGGRRCAWVCGW